LEGRGSVLLRRRLVGDDALLGQVQEVATE